MALENRLSIIDRIELARAAEKISKQKAKQLFDSGDITQLEIGTFAGLSSIHAYLFSDIYDFAGKLREVDIAKGGFRFASAIYLKQSLRNIDVMPQGNFDEIITKYVEMNIAHPFRDGNGRATRIWLDLILKKEVRKIVDWSLVSKDAYFSAMRSSVTKDTEISILLQQALADQIQDRSLYLRGIDMSFHYEGYSEFKTEEL